MRPSHSSHPNTSRRIFRGRGGATDRQLPKYNAARRRRQQQQQQVTSQHEQLTHDPQQYDIVAASSVGQQQQQSDEIINNTFDDNNIAEVFELEIIDPFVAVPPTASSQLQLSSTNVATTLSSAIDDMDVAPSIPVSNSNDFDSSSTIVLQKYKKEVQHLLQRIQRLRSSWSKSKVGITIVSTYQTNVLHATINILKEWKSIQKYYLNEHLDELNSNNDNVSVGNELFQLIQHSVQCGPLSGSQPGYFKRCGSVVASMVYKYLHEHVVTDAPQVVAKRQTPVVVPLQSQQYNNMTEDGSESSNNLDLHIPNNMGTDDENDDDNLDDPDDNDDDNSSIEGDNPNVHHQPDRINTICRDNIRSDNPFHFTESQIKILLKWKQNAYKASISNEDSTSTTTIHTKPSKSMIQKEKKAQQIQSEKRRIKAMKRSYV